MYLNQTEIENLVITKLKDHKKKLKNDYNSCNPYTKTKFFIFDDLLPHEFVTQVFNSFPELPQYNFRDNFREKKYTFAKLNTLNNSIPEILTDALQSKEVINLIGEITGIKNLKGDPSLYAGGLSRMDKSNFLNPHIDNSHDSNRKNYRRLNILFYVSPDLKEEDGGNFELWDEKVTKPLKIPSKFNRLVVMETSKNSWHSVDPVLNDIQRCCVSNYYFTEESPSSKEYYHVTSFIGRPEQKLQRIYGRVDNFIRQSISSSLRISRGKHLGREK
jgi:Rps23 Pro-64 3,4-dihydroxylase Tpa1-like proline 4-hydroxylase